MRNDVVIIGTGGMAKECYGLLTTMGIIPRGLIAENDGQHSPYPILGTDDWFLNETIFDYPVIAVIANGTPSVRRKIIAKYLPLEGDKIIFKNFMHPGTVVLGQPICGRGNTIMPGGVIQPDVKIGNFNHINMGATIGHDLVMGDGCIINHNAGISGCVTLGNWVLVGAGATILPKVSIGDDATVGAGSVVTKDIPPGETWIGCPARPMRKEATNGKLYRVKKNLYFGQRQKEH